jgi:hypothetical protein
LTIRLFVCKKKKKIKITGAQEGFAAAAVPLMMMSGIASLTTI